LSSLSDPVNSDQSGLCYTVTRYDANAFVLSSINALQNRTDILRDEYMADYQQQIETLTDSLNGMWDAIQTLGDDENEAATYTVIVDNSPSARGYDIDIQLGEVHLHTSGGETSWTSTWNVIVYCPGCPDGNFSSPLLQEVYDFVYGLNTSNISDFIGNRTSGPLPVNLSNLVTVNPALIEYPDLPKIDFPLNFNIPIDWGFIVGIAAALDIVLLIYRWYRTVGILARIIRGKNVRVGLKPLRVKEDEVKCCHGRNVIDKVLSMVMWIHDKCYYLRYNMFKMFYWVMAVLQLLVVAAAILIMYYIADQVLTVDFISDLGTFNLMTTGIAAQRAVRNQVLSTTALSYNNYTISTIEQASTDFAATKNQESWEWNLKELERVDEWNNYFCTAWAGYQSTVRDVASDGEIRFDSTVDIDSIGNLFDDDISSVFSPFTEYTDLNDSDFPVTVDMELPVIEFTDAHSSFWEISQIQIHWNFHIDNSASFQSSDDHIAFSIFTKLDPSQKWIDQTSAHQNGHQQYEGSSFSKLNDIQSINMHLNETRFIRLTFSSASHWSDAFEIAEIRLFGAPPRDKIVCDKVQFHFWSFDASDVVMEECPAITPVFGNMYRGFVRSWINEQLMEAHISFILAARNIALSPFFILMGGTITLTLVYILAFMIEWLLMRFDLFRENLYAKIPLITTKWNEYDPDRHYVDTTRSDTEDDTEPDYISEELGGGGPMSPRERKKGRSRYLASPGAAQFSPIRKMSKEDEIELSIISPRGPQFVPLEDTEEASEGILKSAEKTNPGNSTGKNRSKTSNRLRTPRTNRSNRLLSSPDRPHIANQSFGARTLAQIMFQKSIGNEDAEDDGADRNEHGHRQSCIQQ